MERIQIEADNINILRDKLKGLGFIPNKCKVIRTPEKELLSYEIEIFDFLTTLNPEMELELVSKENWKYGLKIELQKE